MSRFSSGDSFDFDPCGDRCREKVDCGCNCVEDPSIRSLRKQLCRLDGDTVVIVSDNFFAITTGVVDRVTCGTVQLVDAEVFGVSVGRVTIALSKINILVPVANSAAATTVANSLRAGARA